MHVAGRIALAAGGLALGATATKLMHDAMEDRYARDRTSIDAQTSTARAEWTTFTNALEAEFPGRELYSREDHARFEQFLQHHPAPSWVDVEHEGFTRVHVSTDGVLDDTVHRPISQESAYLIGFGGFAALGGAAWSAASVVRPGLSPWGSIGGAAIAAFGVGSTLGGIQTARFESTAFDASDTLVREVNAGA